MTLNLDKSETTIFKKTRVNFDFCLSPKIPVVNSLKILGVTFSDDLSWKIHINNIHKKCCKNMYVIRKLRNILSKKDMKTLFLSIIETHYNYCSSVFVSLPENLEKKLKSLCTRFHHIVCHSSCGCSIIDKPKDVRHKKP